MRRSATQRCRHREGYVRLSLLSRPCGSIVRDCLDEGCNRKAASVVGTRTLSSEQAQDVAKIVTYGSAKTALKFIAFSALVLVTGLVVAFGKKEWLLGGPLAAVAAAAIVWQIHGLRSGEPFLRLSPAGLRLNLDGRVFLDIPWQEVEAISSLDLTFEVVEKRWYDLQGGTSPGYFLAKDQCRDVTALQVSEAFHDQTILPFWRTVAGTRGFRRLAGVGMATFMLPKNATASGLSNIFPTKDGKRFIALPIACSLLTAISFAPKSRPVGRPSARGRTRTRDRRRPCHTESGEVSTCAGLSEHQRRVFENQMRAWPGGKSLSRPNSR
jgi:hypothetical protein